MYVLKLYIHKYKEVTLLTISTTATIEATYIGNEITAGREILTAAVFKELYHLFIKHTQVYIQEYGDVKDSNAEIIYVGHRFATVQLPNGYRVAINYGSILDNQNQKEEIVSQIKFI